MIQAIKQLFQPKPKPYSEQELTEYIIKFGYENYRWTEGKAPHGTTQRDGSHTVSCEVLCKELTQFYRANGKDLDRVNEVWESTMDLLEEQDSEVYEFLMGLFNVGLIQVYI